MPYYCATSLLILKGQGNDIIKPKQNGQGSYHIKLTSTIFRLRSYHNKLYKILVNVIER